MASRIVIHGGINMLLRRDVVGISWLLAVTVWTGLCVGAELPTRENTEAGYFQSLTQPDGASCCGPADAYWADDFKTNPLGQFVAIVTDTRPDNIKTSWGGIIRRAHIPPGTEFVVPPNVLRHRNPANDTGHTILFVGIGTEDMGNSGPHVYCYIPQAGG